jgi:hypothetical protein
MRAACVGGDVAADLRLLGRPRIGREQQAVLARKAAHGARPEACLDADAPAARVKGADRAQPLKAEHDAAIERHRPAREPGASAARHDLDPVLVAVGEHPGDLLGAGRQHHGVRPAPDPAALGLIGEIGGGRPGQDGLAAEQRFECLRGAPRAKRQPTP